MAGGEYVSVSAQKDSEIAVLDKERLELRTMPEREFAELAALYEEKGLTPELARQVVVQLHAKDALAAHAETELGLDPTERANPWTAAVTSAVSFALGAMFPLLAIMLSPAPTRVPVTFVVVIFALIATGYLSASTNFHYALPAMARYLCASGAGQDLRKAIFAYNHADWYVAEVVQLAGRFGGIGPTGDGLVDGWADRPPLNQYDRRNYASDQSWLTWRAVDCSAAALDWLLAAYGHTLGNLDTAIAAIGPGRGISSTLGLTDARGLPLAQVLNSQGLRPRTPGATPLGSTAELKAWLDKGPLLMDGAHWFGEGHWFVGIGYDHNGIYIRDSSGYDTRYLTWSRLYGEVGFSGWVVGVAPR